MFDREETTPQYHSTAHPDQQGFGDDPVLDSPTKGLTVEQRTIKSLKHAEYNPRFITDVDFENLKRSITKFGFVQPVVVNMYPGRENIIVGGHMRVEAAKQLGYTDVPCVLVQLDAMKEKEANLALNKISGDWDEVKLGEVLLELEEAGGEIELTGFSPEEMDKYAHTQEGFEDVGDTELETPDKGESKPITCPECGHEWER